MFFSRAITEGGHLFEGAFILNILKILKKGGGAFIREGRLKEGGRLIEVIRYFNNCVMQIFYWVFIVAIFITGLV